MNSENLDYRIHIDLKSGVPIYQQIMDWLRLQIATGKLKAEDRLPSVRALSDENKVNPNTVARAYLELERDGVIYKKQGRGTFVDTKGETMDYEEKIKIVKPLLDKAVKKAFELKMSKDEIGKVIQKSLANLWID